ncbi:MAG: TIGR00303 family protein [Cyanobacteria bacterium RI_101]|nr:TIGR00303 family protein [Cyanobacteria bacterium RI_101]
MLKQGVTVYTQTPGGEAWLERYHRRRPHFCCLLGFTTTGLIEGVSAAGKTPQDRRYTALADAEFLINGPQPNPRYPLPPLISGVSPAVIARALVQALEIPVTLFNTGLPEAPNVPAIDLGGKPADCLSTGQALPLDIVKQLWNQGLIWGERLAQPDSYLILSECVVGGTATALALLTALGIDAQQKVNSSHPQCNHDQKWRLVQEGLSQAPDLSSPLHCVAALGDPMQIAAAGMALGAAGRGGVLLAGGTQMLAVYALMRALAQDLDLTPDWGQIAVGTTPWVAKDPTGDTVGLARLVGPVPLLAAPLNFAQSPYPQLRVYEEGFVKEGVGAGGLAVAAALCRDWGPERIQSAVEALLDRYQMSDIRYQ